MKRFEEPKMRIQLLEKEEIMGSSNCWESFYCEKCYETVNVCVPAWSCDGLVCGCLMALDF